MSGAPATKYTERDVKENENLRTLAYLYLASYQGDFAFLVDCKQRVELDMTLTTGMVKGILNCMRVDPRLPYDLPEPLLPDAEVIEMFPKKKDKKKKKNKPFECPLLLAGLFHHHKDSSIMGWKPDDDYMRHCSGLYRINRITRYMEAHPHEGVIYAVGKSPASKMLHSIDHMYTVWRPLAHEYGWTYDHYPYHNYRKASEFETVVKLGCKHPSWLKNPILLRQSDVDEYHGIVDMNYVDKESGWWKTDGKANPTKFVKCKRCFPDE
jgi:hypothetical protein